MLVRWFSASGVPQASSARANASMCCAIGHAVCWVRGEPVACKIDFVRTMAVWALV